MANPSQSSVDEIDSASLLKALKAFQRGDFSVRLPMNWLGMAGKIADTFNEVAEMNERLASELDRLNRVVGQQGKITQRASAAEMTGGWVDCIGSVNSLIDDLVSPTHETARVIVQEIRLHARQRAGPVRRESCWPDAPPGQPPRRSESRHP